MYIKLPPVLSGMGTILFIMQTILIIKLAIITAAITAAPFKRFFITFNLLPGKRCHALRVSLLQLICIYLQESIPEKTAVLSKQS